MNNNTGRKIGLKSAILGTASTAAMLLLAGGAQAQQAAAAAGGGDVEQVVVTGSRITIPGYQSPTPITAVSAQELQVKSITQVQDLFNDIPQLLPFTGSSSGSQNVNQASFNLRGVGTSRTLVMLDGRRFASTQPTGGVDSGVFPTSVIKSVSVVTGGASAAYGSDAMAGVVNIELDNKYDGFKAGVNGGGTSHMDSLEAGGYVQAGTSFAGGKGNIMAAAEAFTNNGFLEGNRSWGRQGKAIISNPACAPTCPAGQYKNIIITDVAMSRVSDGGVITAGPLANIQFGPGGVIAPFQTGAFAGTTYASGGDGTDESTHANLSDEFFTSQNDRVHRDDAYTHVEYEVLPDVTVWADALYAIDLNSYYVIPNFNIGDITVTRQNAFLPAAVASLMDANKITSFLMGRANEELGWNYAGGRNTSQRYSFGLDGSFGETWKWHAFGQFADNRYYTTQGNNRKEQAWKNSIDSLLNPAVNGAPGVPVGTPICRNSLPGATYTLVSPAGCVPVNLFGFQGYGSGPIPQFTNGGNTTWSPALLNYTDGTSFYDETNVENDFAVNVTGQPFEDWAGPISVAFGYEHRLDGIAGTSDPLSQASGWRQVNGMPLIGKFTVDEGYLETEIPLAKNIPWAEDLNVNAAGRITNYTTSGMVETWKIGLNWTPFEEVRFRATRSTDIRAPGLSELFQAGQMNNITLTDPRTNQVQQSPSITGGNPNLLPETGHTVTAGAVYSPSWLDGFTVSADYYQLHITGAIATLPQQTVVNNCFGTTGVPVQPSYCSQVTLDTSGKIVKVVSGPFNSQAVQTDGWDFEGTYSIAAADMLPGLGLGGDVHFHALGSWTRTLVTAATGVLTQSAGKTIPHWRWNATMSWTNNPWTWSLDGRWIGNIAYSTTYVEGVDVPPNGGNKIDGRFTVNTTMQYQFSDNIQLYGRVRNLFDVDPPFSPFTANIVHAVGSTLYDVEGRNFQVGIRLNY